MSDDGADGTDDREHSRGQDSGTDDGHGHGHGRGHGHSHGHSHGGADDLETDWDDADGLRLEHRIAAFRRWLHEWAHGLWHGMVEHPAFEKIEKEAEDVEDEFLFACFADAFGIPSPVSYYTVELLPYMAEEFEQFERRMWDRESLLERKGQQYHFH